MAKKKKSAVSSGLGIIGKQADDAAKKAKQANAKIQKVAKPTTVNAALGGKGVRKTTHQAAKAHSSGIGTGISTVAPAKPTTINAAIGAKDTKRVKKQVKRINQGRPALAGQTKAELNKEVKRTHRNAVYQGISDPGSKPGLQALANKGERDRKVFGTDGPIPNAEVLKRIPTPKIRESVQKQTNKSLSDTNIKLKDAHASNDAAAIRRLKGQKLSLEKDATRLKAQEARGERSRINKRILELAVKPESRYGSKQRPKKLKQLQRKSDNLDWKVASTKAEKDTANKLFHNFQRRQSTVANQREAIRTARSLSDLRNVGVEMRVKSINGNVIPKERRDRYVVDNFYKGGSLGTVKRADIQVKVKGRGWQTIKMPDIHKSEEDVAGVVKTAALLAIPIPVGKIATGSRLIKTIIAGSRAAEAVKATTVGANIARTVKAGRALDAAAAAKVVSAAQKARAPFTAAKAAAGESKYAKAVAESKVAKGMSAGKARLAARSGSISEIRALEMNGKITAAEARAAEVAANERKIGAGAEAAGDAEQLTKVSKAGKLRSASMRKSFRENPNELKALGIAAEDAKNISRPFTKAEMALSVAKSPLNVSKAALGKATYSAAKVIDSPAGTYGIGAVVGSAALNPNSSMKALSDIGAEFVGVSNDILQGRFPLPPGPGELAKDSKNILEGMARLTGRLFTDADYRKTTFNGLLEAGSGLVILPFYLTHEALSEGPGQMLEQLAQGITQDVQTRWQPIIDGDWDKLNEVADANGGAAFYLMDFWPAAAATSWAAKGALVEGSRVLPGVRATKVNDWLTSPRNEIIFDHGPSGAYRPMLSNRLIKTAKERALDRIRVKRTETLRGRQTSDPEGKHLRGLADKLDKRSMNKIDQVRGMNQPVLPLITGTWKGQDFPVFSGQFGERRLQRQASKRAYGQGEMLHQEYIKNIVIPMRQLVNHRKFTSHINGKKYRLNQDGAAIMPYWSWTTGDKPHLLPKSNRSADMSAAIARAAENDLKWLKLHRDYVLENRRSAEWANLGKYDGSKYDEITKLDELIQTIEQTPQKVYNEANLAGASEWKRLQGLVAKADPRVNLDMARGAIHKTQLLALKEQNRIDSLHEDYARTEFDEWLIEHPRELDPKNLLKSYDKALIKFIKNRKERDFYNYPPGLRKHIEDTDNLNSVVDAIEAGTLTGDLSQLSKTILKNSLKHVDKVQRERLFDPVVVNRSTKEQYNVIYNALLENGLSDGMYYKSIVHPELPDSLVNKLQSHAQVLSERADSPYPNTLDAKDLLLHKLGLQDTRIHAQLRETTVRGYQIRDIDTVVNLISKFSLDGEDGAAALRHMGMDMKSVLGTNSKGHIKPLETVRQFKDVIIHSGGKADDYFYLDTDILGERLTQLDPTISGGPGTVRHNQAQSLVKILEDSANPTGTSTNLIAIRKSHMSQIITKAKNYNRIFSTVWDMPKAFSSRLLLAPNISWLQFQVYANALTAGIAGVGPRGWIEARNYVKKMTPEAQKSIDRTMGVQAHHADISTMNADLSRFYHSFLTKSYGYRRFVEGHNFFNAFFRIDAKNNKFFRRAVLHNRMKREAYRQMNTKGSRILNTMDRIMGKKPKDYDVVMETIARDPRLMDTLAKDVESFMGDYLNFTPMEREVMQRSVMFYGFLRHSLQFTLWNLPVKHPMRLGLISQLVGQGIDDIKATTGMEQIRPQDLGKFYLKGPLDIPGLGTVKPEPTSGLVEIDLNRASIVGNFLTEALASPSPSGKVLSSTSPFYIPFLEASLGQSIYRDAPLRSDGNPVIPIKPQLWGAWFGAKGEYVAMQEARLFRPFRLVEEMVSKYPFWRKSDDSTLFNEKPYIYSQEGAKEAYTQAKEDTKIFNKNKEGGIGIFSTPLSDELLPFAPRPSTYGSTTIFNEEQQQNKLDTKKGRQKTVRQYENSMKAIESGADMVRGRRRKSSPFAPNSSSKLPADIFK